MTIRLRYKEKRAGVTYYDVKSVGETNEGKLAILTGDARSYLIDPSYFASITIEVE